MPYFALYWSGVRAIMTSHNVINPGMTSSVYMSPVFRSSHLSYGQCLRFRYSIYGPGTRKLRIYHHLKVDNYAKRLVWFANTSNSTESAWHYGKAAISGVSEYKVCRFVFFNFLDSVFRAIPFHDVDVTMAKHLNGYDVVHSRLEIRQWLSILIGNDFMHSDWFKVCYHFRAVRPVPQPVILTVLFTYPLFVLT